jgi:hypothetical protein
LTLGWYIIIGAAAIWEAVAIISKRKGDTLSEHVWKWFAVNDPLRRGGRGLRRTVLLLGMVWLTAHFVTGGRV